MTERPSLFDPEEFESVEHMTMGQTLHEVKGKAALKRA